MMTDFLQRGKTSAAANVSDGLTIHLMENSGAAQESERADIVSGCNKISNTMTAGNTTKISGPDGSESSRNLLDQMSAWPILASAAKISMAKVRTIPPLRKSMISGVRPKPTACSTRPDKSIKPSKCITQPGAP